MVVQVPVAHHVSAANAATTTVAVTVATTTAVAIVANRFSQLNLSIITNFRRTLLCL